MEEEEERGRQGRGRTEILFKYLEKNRTKQALENRTDSHILAGDNYSKTNTNIL